MRLFGYLVLASLALNLVGCAVTIGERGRIMRWTAADGFCAEVHVAQQGGSVGHCAPAEGEGVDGAEVP